MAAQSNHSAPSARVKTRAVSLTRLHFHMRARRCPRLWWSPEHFSLWPVNQSASRKRAERSWKDVTYELLTLAGHGNKQLELYGNNVQSTSYNTTEQQPISSGIPRF